MRKLNEAHLSSNFSKLDAYLDRRLRGVQTGIRVLDSYLLGLGGVTVFQGDTGCNKSTLALQILHYNAKAGSVGIIFDKENGEGRLHSRLLCQANKLTETDLLVSKETQRVAWRSQLGALPIYIFTEALRDFDAVERTIAEGIQKAGNKSLILLIDSLQAMTPADDDQRVSLEKWMHFLDALKVQYNGKLTVLVTSETKRAGYGNEDGIGRGKGSNAIEFKAETLLDMRDAGVPGEVVVQVAKHRDGIKGERFFLRRVLKDERDLRSFVFLMEPRVKVEL